eukprot:SAG22_NODE_12632_length_435_cov_0.827381_2_plen_85_part_01
MRFRSTRNCCAAAKRYGCAQVVGPEPDAAAVLGPALAPVACWPPRGDPNLVNRRHRGHSGGLAATIMEYAAEGAAAAAAAGRGRP